MINLWQDRSMGVTWVYCPPCIVEAWGFAFASTTGRRTNTIGAVRSVPCAPLAVVTDIGGLRHGFASSPRPSRPCAVGPVIPIPRMNLSLAPRRQAVRMTGGLPRTTLNNSYNAGRV